MKLKIDICCVIDIKNTDGLYPCDQIADYILRDEMLRDRISCDEEILYYDVDVTEVTDD